MATDQPLQDVVHHGDALHDLRLWAKQQVLRIEALSKQDVLYELQGIMEGHTYSWHCINNLLQSRFDEGSLEFSLVDGDVLFEWNNLCNEKQVWEKKGRLSVDIAEFNMDCLINLKILPVQAGLGIEVPRLVTSNMDKPNISAVDLWAGPKDLESLRSHVTSKFLADDDASPSESEDSDYVDEYETEDEVVEHKDMKFVDFDQGIDGEGSDEERTEDEDVEGSGVDVDEEDLGKDESEDYDDNSDQSDEVDTEDEDVEGLGVKIVDVDDENDISDLEL